MTHDSRPVTDADLHAFVDGQLMAERHGEVEAHLAANPEASRRVAAWADQARGLRALFDPVLDEAVPRRLVSAARPARSATAWRVAAGVALLLLGGSVGWGLRAQWPPAPVVAATLPAFAERAAVAHAVFVPEQRRPVEVDAAHEDQLVTWLSKRMNAPMKAPHLQSLGYTLEGGRLLPGGQGPVAQFMYRRDEGQGPGARLTLYVTRETGGESTAFRFGRQGGVNVFYWVEGPFGYAISGRAGKEELARISEAVYRQLERTP